MQTSSCFLVLPIPICIPATFTEILFIPLGVMLSIHLKEKKQVIALILACTCFFEITQFLFGWGILDVDDLWLNTLGGLIGLTVVELPILVMKKQTWIQILFYLAVVVTISVGMLLVVLFLYNGFF